MSSSHISYMINQWSYSINQISLVGALEHFYLPYIGNNHPNWLSHFSEELKPPSRNVWGTIHLFLLKSFYCKFKKTLDQVNQAPIVDVVFDKSHNSTTVDQFPTFPNCGCLGYNPRVFSTFLEANLSGCLRQSLSQSGLCLAASGEVTDLDHRLTSYLGNLYIFN